MTTDSLTERFTPSPVKPFMAAFVFAMLLLVLGSAANAVTYYSQGSVTPTTLANWNTVRAGGGTSPANWTPAVVPGTAARDTVGLTFNITAARTITIDTTGRTVGTLNIGDPTTSFFAYTLAASGGGTLTSDLRPLISVSPLSDFPQHRAE